MGTNVYPVHFVTLLLPHLVQQSQPLVIALRAAEVVERLHQQLLHTQVLPPSRQVLDSLYEFGIDVPGERPARVVGQNADQHDAVVLHVRRCVVVAGQELADQGASFSGGRGRGLAGFDDAREIENFFTLLFKLALVRLWGTGRRRTVPCEAPDSQKSRWKSSASFSPHHERSATHHIADRICFRRIEDYLGGSVDGPMMGIRYPWRC